MRLNEGLRCMQACARASKAARGGQGDVPAPHLTCGGVGVVDDTDACVICPTPAERQTLSHRTITQRYTLCYICCQAACQARLHLHTSNPPKTVHTKFSICDVPLLCSAAALLSPYIITPHGTHHSPPCCLHRGVYMPEVVGEPGQWHKAQASAQ